ALPIFNPEGWPPMSNDSEKWHWVDEDPIEKMLQPARRHGAPGPPPPPAAEALLAEGRVQFDQRRFEVAASCFSEVVDSEPEHPTAHFDLAVCLAKMEQWKTAADAFRRALEIDPGRAQALIGLGACLLHLDGAEPALACFEQCLPWGVHREPALFGKAVALQQLARYEEAHRAYGELLQIHPDSAEPLANLIALSVARQDAAAIAEYSRRL